MRHRKVTYCRSDSPTDFEACNRFCVLCDQRFLDRRLRSSAAALSSSFLLSVSLHQHPCSGRFDPRDLHRIVLNSVMSLLESTVFVALCSFAIVLPKCHQAIVSLFVRLEETGLFAVFESKAYTGQPFAGCRIETATLETRLQLLQTMPPEKLVH